ncbi:MAG: RNA polymerase sigma factor [Polaromonas sp.]
MIARVVVPSPEVEQFINGARLGDMVAMDHLLRRLQPDVRRYARRNCASADIEDAVQDAMLIIYQRAGKLKFIAALSSWLFKIVSRICVRLKMRAVPAELFDDDNVEHAGTASQDSAHLRLDLVKILAGLEPHQRDVLLLSDVLGYSDEETAMQLHISVQAAKSRLHRARASVRNKFKEKTDHDIRE